MAKGPEIVITDHERQADCLERWIDDHLERHQYTQPAYGSNHRITIDCPKIAVTQQALDILRHRYMQAGWLSLDIEHDQRDGNYLILKYG